MQNLKEKMQVQELLVDTDNRVDRWLDAAEQLFTFARDALQKFATGDLEIKKSILSALGSNLLLKDKKLSIDLENSLFPMKTVTPEVKAIHERLEPLGMPINKREIEQLYARSPRLLRTLNDVRTFLMTRTGYFSFVIVKSW